MPTQLTDQDQTRMALAGLFVAFARTLAAQGQGDLMRFEANLERVYRQLEDSQTDWLRAMETIRWAKELLHDRA